MIPGFFNANISDCSFYLHEKSSIFAVLIRNALVKEWVPRKLSGLRGQFPELFFILKTTNH